MEAGGVREASDKGDGNEDLVGVLDKNLLLVVGGVVPVGST